MVLKLAIHVISRVNIYANTLYNMNCVSPKFLAQEECLGGIRIL